MLKRYDSTQASWIDTNSIKRYDTTQQSWVDVNSVKKYDTTQQAWVEMAYKYISADSIRSYFPEGSECHDTDDGLGIWVALRSYATLDNNAWLEFTIDNLNFPAGTKVKFTIEHSNGNNIRAGVHMYSEVGRFYAKNDFLSNQDVEIEASSNLVSITFGLYPGLSYSYQDTYCSGYLRNIEIGGMKFKFPDISINE